MQSTEPPDRKQQVEERIARVEELVRERKSGLAYRLAKETMEIVPKECADLRLRLYALVMHLPDFFSPVRLEGQDEKKEKKGIVLGRVILADNTFSPEQQLTAAMLLSALDDRGEHEQAKGLDVALERLQSADATDKAFAFTVIACQSDEPETVKTCVRELVKLKDRYAAYVASRAVHRMFAVRGEEEEGVAVLDEILSLEMEAKTREAIAHSKATLMSRKLSRLLDIMKEQSEEAQIYGREWDGGLLLQEMQRCYGRVCGMAPLCNMRARCSFHMVMGAWHCDDVPLARSYLAVAQRDLELLLESKKITPEDGFYRHVMKWGVTLDEYLGRSTEGRGGAEEFEA